MIKWLRDIALAARTVLVSPSYVALFVVFWAVVLTLFLAISRSSVLGYVLTSGQFTAVGKLRFVGEMYGNFFAYLLSPVVLTAFVFTILAAFNVTLLVYMARVMQLHAGGRGSAGAAGAMIASHVLSCGSSLLAPFFSALAGSSAYNDPGRLEVAAVFGLVLNLVGLVLLVRSTASVARHIRHMQ